MKHLVCIPLLLIAACATLCAQNNPAPLVYQPLSPASAAPTGPAFTLTVSGNGFVSGAVVKWNGSARTTTFVSSSRLQAAISSNDIASVGTAFITVVNPAPGGGTSNVVYFPVRTPAASVAFAPNPNSPAATGPVVTGDFNGDNKLDVAVGTTSPDGTAGNIMVYRGNGNGTFTQPILNFSNLPVQSLMVGDFNGDGELDTLIGTKDGGFGPAEGIVFLNNGSGKFTEQTPFGTGDFGGPIAVGDLNGDGNLDVVFSSEVEGSATVYFYLGNGAGSFTLKQQQDLLGEGGGLAAVGDFNGDGILDVAVPDSGQIDVFIGNGDGTFKPYVGYSTTCGGVVAAADVNGDGKLDLVSEGLCVLLGNGDGTFGSSVSYVGSGAGVIFGDFNGDGKLDVASYDSTSLLVSLGNGDGTFQTPVISSGFTGLVYIPAVGDFNRDGQLDLAATGSSTTTGFAALQTTLALFHPCPELRHPCGRRHQQAADRHPDQHRLPIVAHHQHRPHRQRSLRIRTQHQLRSRHQSRRKLYREHSFQTNS